MDDNWIILFFLWYYLFGLAGQEAAFPHSMVGQTFSLSVVPLLWRLSGEPPPGLHSRSVPETNGRSDEQLNLIFAGTPGELWWGKHLPARDGQRQDPPWFTVSSSQIPVLFYGLIEAAECHNQLHKCVPLSNGTKECKYEFKMIKGVLQYKLTCNT